MHITDVQINYKNKYIGDSKMNNTTSTIENSELENVKTNKTKKSLAHSKETSIKSKKTSSERYLGKFSLTGNEKISILEDYLTKLNDKKFGRKVNWGDALLHFISKYGDKESNAIQESILTKKDRVLKRIHDLNQDENSELDIYDIAAKQLKIQ